MSASDQDAPRCSPRRTVEQGEQHSCWLPDIDERLGLEGVAVPGDVVGGSSAIWLTLHPLQGQPVKLRLAIIASSTSAVESTEVATSADLSASVTPVAAAAGGIAWPMKTRSVVSVDKSTIQ